MKDCCHELKVQKDTFTPLFASLRLNERPEPMRPMLENTRKVQETLNCLGDVQDRDAKLLVGKQRNLTMELLLNKSKRVLTIRLNGAIYAALMALRELTVCSSHVPAPCRERVAMQAEATKVLSFFAETVKGKNTSRKSF